MNTYFVTYSLDDQSHYADLSDRLKRYPNWAKIFARAWIIKSSKSSKKIRDEIIESIDNQGRVLVLNITDTAWASYRIDEEVLDWMKENV